MTEEARAYWLTEPGRGEIRPAALRRPEPGEVLVRTVRTGVSRGTETLVFRGEVPADQYATMRAPFQEGDFPGPVKYGYLNVGVVEDGPGELVGRTVFCLYPHQSALRRAGDGRDRGARRCAGRARGPRRHRRDRGQRAVGRARRWSATGSPSSAPAWWAAASLGCSPGSPASRSPSSTSTRPVPSVAAALGADFCAPADAVGRSRPRRPHQRDVGRPAAVAGPARARGHRARPELVRRPTGRAVAGRRLPLAAG